MMKKGYGILVLVVLICGMLFAGCGNSTSDKKETDSKDSVVGKWVSTAIKMEGETEMKLDAKEDKDMIINLAFDESGDYTFTYDGSDTTGTWKQDGNKITIDNTEDVKLEITLVDEKLNVTIAEGQEDSEDTVVWICEKQ